MNHPDFNNLLADYQKRTISAQKAVKTKTEKTLNLIRKAKIIVRQVPEDSLKKLTLVAKQEWYDSYISNRYYDDRETKNAYSADKVTINRWIDNYIRHELMTYDEYLDEIVGKVGKGEAYVLLQERITEEIQKVYPDYGG